MGRGVGGWGVQYPNFFWIFIFFLYLQGPNCSLDTHVSHEDAGDDKQRADGDNDEAQLPAVDESKDESHHKRRKELEEVADFV